MAAAFLANFLFWSGLAIGGIVFAALVDVTGGTWLGPMRVAAERCRRFLPVCFALLLVLLWRRTDIYPALRTKTPTVWFAAPFQVVRDVVALAAVYVCAFAYCRAARAAGADVDRARVNRIALVFLVVYAAGFSVLAVDLIMALEPRWSSTLFPAYVFTGNVYSGAVGLVALARSQPNGDAAAAASRSRDMANVVVGLALFWMYLFWSQFLVIWYGNVTAEVGFMTARIATSRPLGWTVLILCSVVPAFVLVPQSGKRSSALRLVSAIVLAGMWLERWLLVSPDLPAASPLTIALVTIVFAGAFAALVLPRQSVA